MHNSKCLPCNYEHVCIYLKGYTSITKTRYSISLQKYSRRNKERREKQREEGNGGLPLFLLSRKHVKTASLFSSSVGLPRHNRTMVLL